MDKILQKLRGEDIQLLDGEFDVADVPPHEPDQPIPEPTAAGPARLAPALLSPDEARRPIRSDALRWYPTRERRQTDFFGPYLKH